MLLFNCSASAEMTEMSHFIASLERNAFSLAFCVSSSECVRSNERKWKKMRNDDIARMGCSQWMSRVWRYARLTGPKHTALLSHRRLWHCTRHCNGIRSNVWNGPAIINKNDWVLNDKCIWTGIVGIYLRMNCFTICNNNLLFSRYTWIWVA